MNAKHTQLIDCHTHLQDPRFAFELADVWQHANNAGVTKAVCNGTCQADWPGVVAVSQKYDNIIPCFGLHPWFVGSRNSHWLSELETFLDHMPSGIGEIGLDHWIKNHNKKAQEQVFRDQLALARCKQRPVMIHCLRAWGSLMEILRDEKPLPAGMLIHAFGGPVELIPSLTNMNAYFSFAGTILNPKYTRAQEAIKKIPASRLMLETDSPDLLPPPEFCVNNERNEPANLSAIALGVAKLLGLDADELANTLWENAKQFFGNLMK